VSVSLKENRQISVHPTFSISVLSLHLALNSNGFFKPRTIKSTKQKGQKPIRKNRASPCRTSPLVRPDTPVRSSPARELPHMLQQHDPRKKVPLLLVQNPRKNYGRHSYRKNGGK
jgi:hypothetical protein